ncbi:MAG TPA: acetylornithine/succinylornithine family transaminase [Spirochaetota bacterium]|nr:acetylornithine/succinylornithine family transaminase [Spirochaetota bacterium]HOD14223.1 acetylornithine/succinylornithine family transaminase [Spirochaetota bacterium]HPN11399.1 acetylornithine/succinylornithine family transaminase [Spirochaetota bacterium]HQL81179.1 acetylornithine/succinylornithine family transaminase [Spirochaetota bacterium]
MGSAKLKKIMADDKAHLFQNYGDRMPVCFVRGEDSCLFDQDNRKYIDFFSGIAVSSLGHRNRALSKALHRQVDSVLHTSNWYYNREQIEAAALLTAASFPGKTLFVNSGTEANEAAIKLARRYGLSQGKNKYRIISFTNSFHGRTYGGMSATAQKKIHDGFGPLLPGFTYLPFNDTKAFAKEMKKGRDICAVMIELIQGEGGIQIAEQDFVKEIFHLCGKNAVLTIVDEVQTGVGRTGVMFAYQHYGVVPDILTMAKGLGGGVPVGAIHAKNFLPEFFPRGVHGTTFGGNHLACAAVAAVLRQMAAKSFLRNTRAASAFILGELARMKKQFGFIKDVRGMGLHIGIELDRPGTPLVVRALEKGLVINCTADTVIRIMPPLNIPPTIAKAGMKILEGIFLEEKQQ